MSGAAFITNPIAELDPAAWTGCGVAALDRFFRRHALSNDRRGIGKTFVLRDPAGGPAIVGFYTLSMALIESSRLPPAQRVHLPRYPLPVALIGRLAVVRSVHGRGYGEALLADALARVVAAAETIGCFGVIVDAKDARAEAFYGRYGFATVEMVAKGPRRMFLPLETILGV